MRMTAAILNMVENIKPSLVNDLHLLRQTYHCLELFVQQMTKKFLSIILQRICALFKTEMSSLHLRLSISKFQILCTLMYNAVQMSQHYGKVPPCAGHVTVATGCTAD